MTDVDNELCDNDLHLAVCLGDVDAVHQALKEGFHPDTIGLYEWSAFHEAASNGEDEILKILLDNGATVNNPDLLNGNTALHYASAESHSKCIAILLNADADGKILNRKKKTPIDLVVDKSCKEIFLKHGYDLKKDKRIKSILKSNKTIKAEKDQYSKEVISPPKLATERQLSFKDTEARFPSPSTDKAEVFTPVSSSTPIKKNWNIDTDSLLQVPSSPSRSLSSSYGSMTSLGSSGCSAADDCAGQFVLTFQYNSEKFKIRLWEICLITLLPPKHKQTSIDLYVKSVITPDDGYQPNPNLKKKSDIFRLTCGEHPTLDGHCLTSSSWVGKKAWLQFKSSLSLEYSNISTSMVKTSSVQISLCVQRKQRSVSLLKMKSSPPDPVLASVEMKMSDAVKGLMRENYDAERHDVFGLTSSAIPLDAVVAESSVFEDRSINSDPSVHIRMTSLPTTNELITRSSSVNDLSYLRKIQTRSRQNNIDQSQLITSRVDSSVDLSSEEGRDSGIDKSGTYSVSSLESVVSHASVPNPEVHISLPRKKSHQLTSVKVNGPENTRADANDIKITIPRSSKSGNEANKRKQQEEKEKSGIGQKTKEKLRLGGKSLISNAQSVMRSNLSLSDRMDDEERSLGTPRNESKVPIHSLLHHHGGSSQTLVEVNESPTRRHPRRSRIHFPPQTPHSHSNVSTQQRPSSPKSNQWVLDIEPRDTLIDMSGQVGERIGKEKDGACEKNKDVTSKLSANRVQARRHNQNGRLSRDSVLRQLVYDETNPDDAMSANNNPFFINA